MRDLRTLMILTLTVLLSLLESDEAEAINFSILEWILVASFFSPDNLR
jgi:hypothetical protein